MAHKIKYQFLPLDKENRTMITVRDSIALRVWNLPKNGLAR